MKKLTLLDKGDSNKKDEFLTTKEAADLLRVSTTTIFDYCNKGILKKHKIMQKTLFKKSEVLKAIKEIEI